MKTIKFPEDFEKKAHTMGGDHYTYYENGEILVSVVLGKLFYSNGVDTYEMFDLREDEPKGYLTKKKINEHLQNNPF